MTEGKTRSADATRRPKSKPNLPPKVDPLMWRLLGVPALHAYRDAYRVAQRIERGCSQSLKGYRDGLSAERAGGRHE